jgi:regulatory protein
MADNDNFKAVLGKAMAACSRREHCKSEIETMTESWGATESEIRKVIQVLTDEKFIDEERYASAFVRDKFTYNKWGKLKISMHLKSKRIAQEIIKNALDSIDEEKYLKMIRDLISSHRKHVKAKNNYELKSKLLRYGLSKGFESHLLYEILGDLGEETESDER